MPIRRLGFVLPLTLPLFILAGYRLGGAWNFLTVLWTFALIPLADLALGTDPAPIGPRRGEHAGWDRFFDGLLLLWVPVQLALLAFGVWRVGAIEPISARIGFTLSVGIVTGGVGIVVAHELGHRLGRRDRVLAGVLLLSVGYLHFYIEHNQGHHSRVGTPADPATARPGETFWRFLPRAFLAGFASAWHIEATRQRAAGRAVLGVGNRMLWALFVPIGAVVIAGAVFGAAAAAFLAAQGVIAASLLELVNYIEHYGLQRRLGADGRFERVGVEHSWNSSQRLSNWLTFNLQRHSHHHVHVTRQYQELEHSATAPQLPTGYGGMLVLALVPPWWRAIMDPRLAAWQQRQGIAG